MNIFCVYFREYSRLVTHDNIYGDTNDGIIRKRSFDQINLHGHERLDRDRVDEIKCFPLEPARLHSLTGK